MITPRLAGRRRDGARGDGIGEFRHRVQPGRACERQLLDGFGQCYRRQREKRYRDGTFASGYRSIAIGTSDSRAASNDGASSGASYNASTQTRASGSGSVALGAGAVSDVDNSGALGSGSTGAANSSGRAKFSGDAIASGGAASVGTADEERQIKNVTAVRYDTHPDGSINYGSVTLNPGGAQLYQTNQTVSNLSDSTAAVFGRGALYNPVTGTVTGPTFHIAGAQQTMLSDAINALNEG